MEDYKEKLKQFNSTQKYLLELDFLYALLNPKKGERILDVGCGIGTAIKNFYFRNKQVQWLGYDVNPYYEYAFKELPYNLNKVYFMHSLSHIPNPEKLFHQLFERMTKRSEIIIISPNPSWILENKKQYYKPDPTVVEHWDLGTIKEFLNPEFNIISSGQFDSIQEDNSNFNERIFLKAQMKW